MENQGRALTAALFTLNYLFLTTVLTEILQ